MALEPHSRSVILLGRVFQQARLEAGTILPARGLLPSRPYTHESLEVLGAPAHRYTQPPRPAKPLLAAEETG